MPSTRRPSNAPAGRPRTAARRLLTAALTGLCLAGGAAPGAHAADEPAQPPAASEKAEKLERLERRIEQTRARQRALETEAETLAAEIDSLRQEMVAVARDAQDREALMSALERQLDDLKQELATRRAALVERHGQLTGTLGALARLSKDAPRAAFLYPGTPTEAVRGATLLQAAVPALESRARSLRGKLEKLAAVRADIADKLDQLDRSEEALAADRARLKKLIARKRELYARTTSRSEEAQRELERMVAESKSLRELVARLRERAATADAAPETPEEAAPGTEAPENAADPGPETPGTDAAEVPESGGTETARAPRPDGLRAFPDDGRITAPARGELLRRYGEDTGFGYAAKGIHVATRAGAQVVAPHDGRVIFVGPFRDLGPILIIEHDGGYHSVLAGFARIDAVTGQWVLAGEPLGVMPDSPGKAAIETGEGAGRPQLYVELRRNGQPVNPLRWITAGSLKVHG